MKRLGALVLILLITITNKSYGLSNNFSEIISVMGIEKYNTQGYEINEYIYYTYNHVVYGSPEVAINELTQRWKNTANGKWLRNGVKGEYRILGYNNIGKVVNNHDFPMDIVPSTEPTQWNYAILPDAINSWNDISRYKFIEQKQYMQNTNLVRNDITYNIMAMDIGLNKARLDACSTWKTKGLIYTNRIDAYGKKWEATFVTPPIGNNVIFQNAISSISQSYYSPKHSISVDIAVNYYAGIQACLAGQDLKYVKPEHVKKIESSIYINGYLLGTITSSKVLSHSGIATFTVYHEDLRYDSIYARLDIRSKIYTEFTTDGPMYASNSCNVEIFAERYLPSNEVDREILNEREFTPPYNPVPDSNIELVDNNDFDIHIGKIVNKNGIEYVQDLYKSSETVKNNSLGFVNAGSHIAIKVNESENVLLVKMSFKGDNSISTFDDKTQRFEWYEPMQLGNKTIFDSIEQYYNLYNEEIIFDNTSKGVFVTKYLVPYETRQTLHSWNTIRDIGGSSFNINKGLLLSRISNPYIMQFEIYRQIEEECENGINIYTQKEIRNYNLDIFECWTNLYNRDISPYILNDNINEVEYEKWESM